MSELLRLPEDRGRRDWLFPVFVPNSAAAGYCQCVSFLYLIFFSIVQMWEWNLSSYPTLVIKVIKRTIQNVESFSISCYHCLTALCKKGKWGNSIILSQICTCAGYEDVQCNCEIEFKVVVCQ